MAVRLYFDRADLLRVRFATSPLLETVIATRALVTPQARVYLRPWWQAVRSQNIGEELGPLLAVQRPYGYMPDFLCPPPSGPAPRIEDQLAEVRATAPAAVKRDLERALSRQPDAAARRAVRELLEEPAAARDRLADLLEVAWRRLVLPWWPRIRELPAADIAHRSRALAEHGLGEVINDLDDRVRWKSDRIEVRASAEHERTLDGAGLVLIPSAFTWPIIAVVTDPPWRPALVYPARGIATLWRDRSAEAPQALARLVGKTRAALLVALDVPASTATLAERHGLSPSGVSAHLTALHRAGLLTRRRHGHEVRYGRTPLGDLLVDAASP